MAEGGPQLQRSQESIGDYHGDPESVSQSSQNVQRAKLDKLAQTKQEEDRRRRTIIIEKKNGTFGFTLQSYGIHYKKEHEVEMITYVDYIEYGGPAYKSGMREGDVILSINGADMEKADHKSLVAFIKNCDSRMRIVVLFEDCVRKVELHMRYIQLQNVLQTKMNELERTCLKERELLEGKWKTHSLPARKKTNPSSPSDASVTSPTADETETLTSMSSDPMQKHVPVSRPISTEDVNIIRYHKRSSHIIAPPVQFMLTYQYLDPRCRYVLRPSTSSSSSDYLLASIGPPTRSKSDHQQYYLGNQNEHEHEAPQMSGGIDLTKNREEHGSSADGKEPIPTSHSSDRKSSKSSRHCHGHSCNPCIWNKTEKNVAGDNVSLDAYDLASPCCNPHCVPTRRRVKHKEHKHKHREKETNKHRPQRFKSQPNGSPSGQQHPSADAHHYFHSNEKHNHRKIYDMSADLASHCSLHSCISSSDFDGTHAENSTSYTTSLSTDTLYWDPHSDTALIKGRQQSTKSHKSEGQPHSIPPKPDQVIHYHHHHQQRYHIQQTPTVGGKPSLQPNQKPTEFQIQSQYLYHKPKSWDNLAMKAFGGYGFGYGYLDKAAPKSQGSLPAVAAHSKTATLQTESHKKNVMAAGGQNHSMPRKNIFGRYSTFSDVENYAPPPSQFVQEFSATYVTKSTENLLDNYNMSNSTINSASCECSVANPQHSEANPQDCLGYYSHLPNNTTTTNTAAKGVATISEITRL